ncbi:MULTISPECIES: HAD family hydrolase [unclassified Thioalkalivibrio]|uniref:HAD family hydrolase n=1 Tax=unclassified Thioalkalivibrio TaxID=2621013 RepID=UPI000365FCD6|nr:MULTISPECIES: HAD family hydrolase [unclassified Thioalkalivibrio]
MTAPQRIVLFDFDGTLTRHDTLFPFLRFALGTPRFLASLPGCLPTLAGFARGRIANQVAKEAVLQRMIGGASLDDLQARGRAFADHVLDRLLRPAGMERLHHHQAAGDTCVLVSASLDLWLRPWAERHGLTDVICSRLAVDDHGYVSGHLEGTNCQGAAKPAAIASWLGRFDPDTPVDLYAAYGDSAGDEPMLQMVTTGYRLRGGRFEPVQAGTSSA